MIVSTCYDISSFDYIVKSILFTISMTDLFSDYFLSIYLILLANNLALSTDVLFILFSNSSNEPIELVSSNMVILTKL